MIVVVLQHKDSNEISALVKELKDKGYKLNIDFDFEYSPGKYDYLTNTDIPKQTKFIFHNEVLSSWFMLTYC